MAAFTLRTPSLDDVAAIAELHRESWRATYTGKAPLRILDAVAEPGLREAQWRQRLAPGWAERGERLVVAEVDGRLVGVAWSRPTPESEAPRPRALEQLWTSADVHGTGVGAALLDAVLGDAPAWLWVHETNARAIAFYRRRGFEAESPRVTRYDGPPYDFRMVR